MDPAESNLEVPDPIEALISAWKEFAENIIAAIEPTVKALEEFCEQVASIVKNIRWGKPRVPSYPTNKKLIQLSLFAKEKHPWRKIIHRILKILSP